MLCGVPPQANKEQIDLNKGCFLGCFQYFPDISVFLGFFLYVGKYRTFGKILKKTEKHSSLRSTKRVVDVYQVSGIYIYILHTYSHIISIAPEGKCQHPAVDGTECLPSSSSFRQCCWCFSSFIGVPTVHQHRRR